MDVSIFQAAQPIAARAYMTQYVALILLILTFVIGSYANQHRAIIAPPQPVTTASLHTEASAPAVPAQRAWFENSLPLNELFKSPDNLLNQEQALALAQLLISHDVDAEIRLSAAGDLRAPLLSSLELGRFILEQGVPTTALRILVDPAATSGSAEQDAAIGVVVRFFKPNPSAQEVSPKDTHASH